MFDRRPHFRVFAGFFFYALMLGAIFPRIGDLQLKLSITEGTLGLALIGSAIGTQVSLALSGQVLARIGYRLAMILTVPFMGLGFVAATLVPDAVSLFFVLFWAGLGIGIVETVLNVETDRIEHAVGFRIMSRAHAFWSLGFMAAALVGGVMAQARIDPTIHILLILGFVAVSNWLVFRDFVPAQKRHIETETTPLFVRPTKPILILVAFTISAMLLEGASLDWTVIYMRDVHGTAPLVNGLTLAAFTFTMAVTRFFADGFLDRFGTLPVSRVLIFAMGLGSLAVAAAPTAFVAVIGYVLLGIGTSAIFPIAMSAAAQRTDRPAAYNVAALAQLSFVTFLLAPPLLGLVAEHFGIRISYAVGLPFVLLSWLALGAVSMGTHQAHADASQRSTAT